MFLTLGKKFRIENKEWKKEEVIMDVEDILYNEKKEGEERDRVRRKVIPIIEIPNKNRSDNLTRKERRGMKEIKRRKHIVIQAVDKGGAVAVIEKEWYKEKMKEQVIEGYQRIGRNIRDIKEEIINKMIENNEEGYGEKGLRNKRRKYINKEGTIPRMKGLPKRHKEEIGIRAVVN